MKLSPKSPETILREALVVACDELKRVNDHYSCVRPDPFGVVLDALQKVPPIPPIPHASEIEKRIVYRVVTDLLAAGLSLQAAGGRITAPADPAYPFRVVIFEDHNGIWSIASVFEAATFGEAEFEAMDICTEPYGAGVTAMHYVIGEAVQ